MNITFFSMRIRCASPAAALLLAASLCGPVSAAAQQTRDEELAAAQAEKATALHPYVPTAAERRVERIARLTVPRDGWYPFIGSAYPGGGVAAGPGYRGRIGGAGSFDAHGARSVKSVSTADAAARFAARAGRPVRVAVRANWTDAPRVKFYGVGPASRDADRTAFHYTAANIGVAAQVDVARRVTVGSSLDYLDVEARLAGENPAAPASVAALTAGGVTASPAFTRTHLFAQLDSRPAAGYATSGGLYRVDWSGYAARAADPFSFHRVDVEVVQLIPLLRENWVIALRALQSVTGTNAANVVPYFLMPDLGGGGTLRGYSSWRFRDRSRTLVGAEYRWMANRFLEMALFADAGTVTPRLRDVRGAEVHTSYGIGGRLHTPATTVLRLDVARTAEGVALVLAFGPSF
jgi:hypothetical protein